MSLSICISSLLNSLSQFADLSQFSSASPANMSINYGGYVMDSNQNIQTSLKGGAGAQGTSGPGAPNGQALPSMLSMQQQSYMQQLLMQSFSASQAAQATGPNGE